MRKYKNVILFFLFVIGFCAMVSLIGTAGALEIDAITIQEAVKQSIGGVVVMAFCLIGDSIIKRVAR